MYHAMVVLERLLLFLKMGLTPIYRRIASGVIDPMNWGINAPRPRAVMWDPRITMIRHMFTKIASIATIQHMIQVSYHPEPDQGFRKGII
jgi:hypothetical protein